MKSKVSGYKILISALILISVLLVFLAGCTGQQPETPGTPEPTKVPIQDFSESDNGKTVRVALNSEFRITLEGNPTTGYMWNATLSDGLDLLDSDYKESQHPEGMVGVGGYFYWDIRATELGEQRFSAIYSRPWEDVTGNETTFEMIFNVE